MSTQDVNLPNQPNTLTASKIRDCILKPLASLKLTVVLMAMAIFLVLAGTVAQVDRDIWFVVQEYFRTPWTWIDLSIFFPRDPDSFKLTGGFPFPGGFTIGLLMAINLLAAHAMRFRVQSTGPRLYAGLAIIAAGCALTWEVITVLNDRVISSESDYNFAWNITRIAATVVWFASVYLLATLDEKLRTTRNVLIGVGAALGTLVGWLWFGGVEVRPGDTRILWQLVQGGLAATVLLVGCVFVFKKRAGIVLLHAGIGLIMANELVVYSLHEEGVVHIREGNWSDYAIDQRSAELAIIDKSPAEHDAVVVIPASKLEAGDKISDDQLPFDVEVLEYVINAELKDRESDSSAPHDSGPFNKKEIVELKPVSGAGAASMVDIPAMYVKFTDRENGKPLGTYLMSANYFAKQQVTVGDKTYDVVLRFKRRYLGFRIHLIDFRFDRYKETKVAKNFSSLIRIDDPDNDVDREVLISMNNPLRYRGTTYYQQDWDKEDEKGTYLQSVTNTGWMVPYVGCMIVMVGMLAQFGTVLLRFLRRRDNPQRGPPDSKAEKISSAKSSNKFGDTGVWAAVIPIFVVAAGAAYLASKARPAKTPDDQMEITQFGELPVYYGGRAMPMDTLARTSLRIASNKQEFVDKYGEKQPAIRWLLDLFADQQAFRNHKCIRVDHPEILKRLGLERRKGYLYSYAEVVDNDKEDAEGIDKLIDEVRKKKTDEFSVVDKRLVELKTRLDRIRLLAICFHSPPFPSSPAGVMQGYAREQQRREFLKDLDKVVAVPPLETGEKWQPYSYAAFDQEFLNLKKEAARHLKSKGEESSQIADTLAEPDDEAVFKLTEIFAAYESKDPAKFSKTIGEYRDVLGGLEIDWNPGRTDFEAWYNHFSPFYYCAALYVIAFVLVLTSWLTGLKVLNRSALALLVLTFIVHSLALWARIYISGRPPVTNLYSSALFIGWGCVLFGLIVEAIYRIGIGNAVAAVTGFGTLLVAHLLVTEVASHRGDTIGVLQAVLDTNFWLATHVTVITLGYATTFLAGFMGIAYVVGGQMTPYLTKDVRREIGRMIYGTVCFSLFFSFVGTVLGGLWADDSWGRFWGWDPKENGALIIVLWNAIVLHARWDGMIRERRQTIFNVA
ncbi:MAG: cytochrome c biogenesis protein CcsA [Pirellulales bacterium]|nr:cytochrome c biogenesis protein CcsA [Pirellulales bacterium]